MIGVLGAAHERVFGSPAQLLASSATTDARFFNLYGSTPPPATARSHSDIHGIDESVSLASTLQVTQGAGAVHGALVRAGEDAMTRLWLAIWLP